MDDLPLRSSLTANVAAGYTYAVRGRGGEKREEGTAGNFRRVLIFAAYFCWRERRHKGWG